MSVLNPVATAHGLERSRLERIQDFRRRGQTGRLALMVCGHRPAEVREGHDGKRCRARLDAALAAWEPLPVWPCPCGKPTKHRGPCPYRARIPAGREC